jgi:hypothetical protein
LKRTTDFVRGERRCFMVGIRQTVRKNYYVV